MADNCDELEKRVKNLEEAFAKLTESLLDSSGRKRAGVREARKIAGIDKNIVAGSGDNQSQDKAEE